MNNGSWQEINVQRPEIMKKNSNLGGKLSAGVSIHPEYIWI